MAVSSGRIDNSLLKTGAAVEEDLFQAPQLLLPSLALTTDERTLFEARSNENQALKGFRECGTLWHYTEMFRDSSIVKFSDLLRSQSVDQLPIYSFGCSTGQEPYSLHLVLREAFGSDYYAHFPITGYDLDSNCIDQALSGRLVISKSEVDRISQAAKNEMDIRYISSHDVSLIMPDHRRVTFLKRDLNTEPFSFSEPVVIFLQNVLYHLGFDQQFAVLDRLCFLPDKSIVCLGSDTYTDKAATEVLCKTGAFCHIGEFGNVLIRRSSIELIIPGSEV